MSTAPSDQLSREDLYRMVWEKPATQIAKDLGVSGSIITRVCRQLNVPKPSLGHWAKTAHGHKVRKPPLPPLKPGEEGTWQIQRTNVEGQRSARRQREEAVEPELDEETREWLAKDLPEHKWVRTTKASFKGTWTSREGRFYQNRNVPHLCMFTSKEARERSLAFLNRVVHLAEKEGIRVCPIDPPPKEPSNRWNTPEPTPSQVVMFHWKGQPIGIQLNEKMRRIEKAEPKSYDRFDYVPTNLLDCSLYDASGYTGRYQWKDGKTQRIEEFIPSIVESIKVAAEQKTAYLAQRAIEEERQKRIDSMMAALHWQQYREENAAKQAMEDASLFAKAEILRSYAAAAEAKLNSRGERTEPGSELGLWLQWLRMRADMIDPLAEGEEPWSRFTEDVLIREE
jgi:hypothetical protein